MPQVQQTVQTQDDIPEKAPLRIVIVCAESMAEGYAPFAHVSGIAKGLGSLGHQVIIVGEDSGPYHEAGLTGRLKRYAIVNRRAMKALSSADVVLARGHFAHFPWVRRAAGKRVPVIHEMNGMMFDAATTHRWLRPMQALINRSYLAQFASSQGIACVTRDIASQFREMGLATPIHVVSNGVDPTIFYPAEADRGRPYAIFPSALARWHGIDTLLEAVSLPEWPAGLDLVIAGDGVQAAAVIERAATDARVRYVGLLSREELAVMLRHASVGLCLVETVARRGVAEVFPLKLFEMMASGLPIVATDLPGQRDLVNSAGAGLVIPPHDAAALAVAVRAIFHDPQRASIGLAGCARVRAEHDWRIRAIELERILRRAVRETAALPAQ